MLLFHHHFFCKTTLQLIDIDSKNIKFSKLPKIPEKKTSIGWGSCKHYRLILIIIIVN